jgi:hypothetical protein
MKIWTWDNYFSLAEMKQLNGQLECHEKIKRWSMIGVDCLINQWARTWPRAKSVTERLPSSPVNLPVYLVTMLLVPKFNKTRWYSCSGNL